MAVKLDDVRRFALGLPETTEEPHHDFGSFRVRGKIFVTLPPGGELVHIFLPEADRELALAMDPGFLEPVLWGGKVLGVRARLPLARKATVLELVRKAHAHKGPKAKAPKEKAPTGSAPTDARPIEKGPIDKGSMKTASTKATPTTGTPRKATPKKATPKGARPGASS